MTIYRTLPSDSGPGRASPMSCSVQMCGWFRLPAGQDEVWVASFPSGLNRRQVSLAGGLAPEWGRGGTEILYISREKQFMATPFDAGEAGKPQVLFRVESLLERDLIFPSSNFYTVPAGAQRFLIAVPVADPNTPPIDVVLNWPALLKP